MITGYIPNFPPKSPQQKVSVLGIDFFDTTFLESGLVDIVNFLKNSPYPIYSLDSKGYKLYDLGVGSYLSEYQEEDKRNNEQVNYQKISETSLPQGILLPKHDGYFNFGGKYFLILGIDKELSNISTQFIYKGMIIDSSLYSQNTSKSIDTILGE